MRSGAAVVHGDAGRPLRRGGHPRRPLASATWMWPYNMALAAGSGTPTPCTVSCRASLSSAPIMQATVSTSVGSSHRQLLDGYPVHVEDWGVHGADDGLGGGSLLRASRLPARRRRSAGRRRRRTCRPTPPCWCRSRNTDGEGWATANATSSRSASSPAYAAVVNGVFGALKVVGHAHAHLAARSTTATVNGLLLMIVCSSEVAKVVLGPLVLDGAGRLRVVLPGQPVFDDLAGVAGAPRRHDARRRPPCRSGRAACRPGRRPRLRSAGQRGRVDMDASAAEIERSAIQKVAAA